ncbi:MULTISPECIES: DUF2971 domain-containing protein [Bacillus cereus group]|uniref:DUF2971 domain-containing protein n=1 Tax=Bacillus cereus group TaxID=86661 RepID=UPI00141945C8|nr:MULTISPECIES: DUF2971 domain-containing protein [Bacillus cereus group]MDA2230952.1 DUF2971 domain-containing protein [Bacillus cereus group sp. Bc227]
MFIEHDDVNSNIEENAKLWRYMDFAKFVSLLSTESLYLCKPDEFDDVFEGRLFGLEKAKKIIENQKLSEGNGFAFGSYEGYSKTKLATSDFLRENAFINCWHLNEEESAAMWGLYVKSGQGIAVQTTFEKIKQSLNHCGKEVYIGKVKYVDHKKEENFYGNNILPFFTKRLSFKHEEEVRIVYSAPNHKEFWDDATIYQNTPGINIKVDLGELIERIYISPDAPPWFMSVVEVVLKKFNLDPEVIHSKLYELN